MRVLAYTSPARGHLYPVTPIAAELVARGHDGHLYGLADELPHLEPLGIACSPIDPAIEAIEILDWQERSLRGAGMSALNTFARRSPREAPDLARAIERHEPEMLVIDINCWGAATVAEASGLPWAMFAPFLLPLRSRDAPPFGLGLRRRSGPAGAIRDALIRRMVGASWDRMAMPTIGRLRAEHGLPTLAHFDDLLARPPLLLSLTAEGFEYPRGDWPANVRLVGAVNWSPPQPAPAWLDDLSDPLVLVTCSTERQRDKRLLHVALEALPANGIAVLGTTAAHDPGVFHAPPGSRVVRFVAHEPILERAVCVVCHGGMGITKKSLAAGIPVVVVPFGRDQLETARRVEFARAGVRLSPRRLTPERLSRAVSEAIGMREGAQRVSRAYAVAGGARAAADAIEALASDRGARRAQDARPEHL
ncbi:MAG TPA: nucleotide disphospho-sugar-binding domain-containing protein [Solirubrobacteraceae bacterium]